MTTLSGIEKTCAVCGGTSEQIVTLSTNSFGSADLDTRPPEMMRSTIHTWVQRCPHCGYCSGDLAELHPNARQVMASELYRDQLDDPALPPLANTFLCWALIQEHAEQYTRAGWNSIHAAWICDDHGEKDGAQRCRRQAIDLLGQAQQNGQIIARQVGAGDAVMVDLMRRAGEFEQARSICEDALRRHNDAIIVGVLRFQKLLIMQGDTGCYTIAQALGNT